MRRWAPTRWIAGVSPHAVAIAAVLAGAVACSEPAEIRFEETYGLCTGYCAATLVLDEDGAGTVTFDAYLGPPVEPIVTPVAISASEAAAVFAALDAALAEPWDDVYGAPGVSDQGTYTVTFDDGAEVHTTMLDPLDYPARFDPLVPSLRQVLRDAGWLR